MVWCLGQLTDFFLTYIKYYVSAMNKIENNRSHISLLIMFNHIWGRSRHIQFKHPQFD